MEENQLPQQQEELEIADFSADNQTMRRSRLNHHFEQEAKRNLLFTVAGIIVLLVFLSTIGLPLLIKLSLMISSPGDTNYAASKKSQTYVEAPVLDATFTATNSAQVTITGSATAKQTVKLYVNDDLVDKVQAKDNGSFTFDGVQLTKGSNSIKAKVITADKKQSDFSNELKITYQDKAPSLSIDYPVEGQTLKQSSTLTMTGKTDPDVQVTVNGFRAIVDDNGNFSYTVTLQNGDNSFKVVAIDKAGNKAEQDRKVTYSP